MKQKLISIVTLLAMLMSIMGMAVSATDKTPDDTEQKGDFIYLKGTNEMHMLENQEYVKFRKTQK